MDKSEDFPNNFFSFFKQNYYFLLFYTTTGVLEVCLHFFSFLGGILGWTLTKKAAFPSYCDPCFCPEWATHHHCVLSWRMKLLLEQKEESLNGINLHLSVVQDRTCCYLIQDELLSSCSLSSSLQTGVIAKSFFAGILCYQEKHHWCNTLKMWHQTIAVTHLKKSSF